MVNHYFAPLKNWNYSAWVTLGWSWVTLGSSWVTLGSSWVTLHCNSSSSIGQNNGSPWPSILGLNKLYNFFTVKISNLSMWIVLVHSCELYICSNYFHCNLFCMNLYNIHGNKINKNIYCKLWLFILTVICVQVEYFFHSNEDGISCSSTADLHQCLKWTIFFHWRFGITVHF